MPGRLSILHIFEYITKPNSILCATPFVPFLVLVSNAVTSRDPTDLPLLLSAVNVLRPLASSPNAGPIYRACLKLYDVACSLVSCHASPEDSVAGTPFIDGLGGENTDPSIYMPSKEFDILTNGLESTLTHDWSTFVDLFGGQHAAEGGFGT